QSAQSQTDTTASSDTRITPVSAAASRVSRAMRGSAYPTPAHGDVSSVFGISAQRFTAMYRASIGDRAALRSPSAAHVGSAGGTAGSPMVAAGAAATTGVTPTPRAS